MKDDTFPVFVLRCGCGHVVTACDGERAKAAMMEHVIFLHRSEDEA